MHSSWASVSITFLGGEPVVLILPFSGTSMISISSVSVSVFTFLWHPTEREEWRTLLAHCLKNTGVHLSGLSLVTLLLFFYPFKSSLKLFQRALLNPVQKSFPPFATCLPHLLPAGLVCKMTHDKEKINSAGDNRLRARYWSADSSCFSLHDSLQLEGWRMLPVLLTH